eukprot:g19778.t1
MPGFRRKQLHKRPGSAPYRSISVNPETLAVGVKDEDKDREAANEGSGIASTSNDSDGSSGRTNNVSPGKTTTATVTAAAAAAAAAAASAATTTSSSSYGTSMKRAHRSSHHHSLLPQVRSASCGCRTCAGGGSSRRKGRRKTPTALAISASVVVSLMLLLLLRPFLGDKDSRSRETRQETSGEGGVGEEKTRPISRGRRWGEGGGGKERIYPGGSGGGDGGDGGGRERGGAGGERAQELEEEEGGDAGAESRGVGEAAVGAADELPREGAPRVFVGAQAKPLSGTAKVCDGYQTQYGIVPEDSWGTAPKKVQDEWKRLNCDRVLGMNGFSLDDPPTRGRDRAIVVVWNDIRGWLDYLRPSFATEARETCPTECVFTNDRSLVSEADGVFFHASTFQKRDGFPRVKPPGAEYVFVNLEPRTYRPVKALLRDKQLMSKFDLTMTYERSSDIPLGYVGDWPTSMYFEAPKPSFKEKDGFGSPDAVAAFVSNCKAAGATERARYMQELMAHATVHSFGHCLHNREEPQLVRGEGATHRQENKIALLARYKFLLAFENNNQLRDYVTEKTSFLRARS